MQAGIEQRWKRLMVQEYLAPMNQKHFPGSYICVRAFDLVCVTTVLAIIPPDIVDFDGGDVVVTCLAKPTAQCHAEQAVRREAGEFISDFQARMECAARCTGAERVRRPLREIRTLIDAEQPAVVLS